MGHCFVEIQKIRHDKKVITDKSFLENFSGSQILEFSDFKILLIKTSRNIPVYI